MCLAATVCLGTTGCSDNYNETLEPLETTHTLSIDVKSDLYSNGKLTLGAAPANITVDVECNTRWLVEIPNADGGWCDVDASKGSGNGSFTITVRENLTEARTCEVKVYMVNVEGEKDLADSKGITITQVASDVRISPSSIEPFPAESPESKEFQIIANVAWNLSVTYEAGSTSDYLSITPIEGDMNENEATGFSGSGDAKFRLILQSNRTAANRTAFLTLSSEVGTYSVEITQLKSNYTFDISPNENQIIPAEGGSVKFGVLSLSDWIVTTAADWIVFSSTSGESSDSRIETIAEILPNASGQQRSTEIRFRPSNPQYPEVSITVTQLAQLENQEPAISVTWLADGYTQTTATIQCAFYSPFYPVTEAGIEWKKENAEEWNTERISMDNVVDGIVSVDLTGLDGGTKYVARGFVVYDNGKVKYGTTSIPFTTAGKRPEPDDNPTPDMSD